MNRNVTDDIQRLKQENARLKHEQSLEKFHFELWKQGEFRKDRNHNALLYTLALIAPAFLISLFIFLDKSVPIKRPLWWAFLRYNSIDFIQITVRLQLRGHSLRH